MVDPAPFPAEPLDNRLAFETLLADLSSRFINLAPGEVDREIEEALRRVCELLAMDVAVLWQWPASDSSVVSPTHAFPSLGGATPLEPGMGEDYPWVVRQMLAGRMVSISSLEELPAEAAVDRDSAELAGIKSNLTLPLAVGGEPPVGALALNSLTVERDWPDEEVHRLRLVAQVFANALARKRHDLDLQESEARLALAADSAEAGLWTLDFGTGIFWATKRGRAIFGYSPDQEITMELFEASIHPDDRALVRSAVEKSERTGEAVNLEYRILSPPGGCQRWVASRGRSPRASAGGPRRLTGVSIDITERRRADEALRTSEARLAAGADLAGLAFYEVDFVEGVMYFDDRLRDLCGVPPDRAHGLQALEFWQEHLHPDDRHSVLNQRDQLHDGRLDRLSIEYRYLHPARGERWIQHLAGVRARDAGLRAVHTFGVLRDVTERKRFEETLRDLSRRLIRAHEEERALLARELHDDLTQRLALLAIDVGRAELAAPDETQAETMRRVRQGLVSLSEDVHSLAYQLHPSVLEELGLAEAIRTECERLGRQNRLDLSVQLDPLPEAPGRDAALCLFRVAQEALSNTYRHAGAHAATVSLRPVENGLLLTVRDDGIGFDPRRPGARRSLGIASMRERVQLVDGTLEVESAPGQGTTILAWVPTDAEPW